MISAIPMTALPLIAYNLIGYSVSGADPWASTVVAVPLPSGAHWSMKLGDLLVLFAIIMLYVEIVRAAGVARGGAVNRTLSIVILAVYVAEFLAADAAAHSVFFALTMIAGLDVVAGFSIGAARPHCAATNDSDGPP